MSYIEWNALAGGALIGLAATLMLWLAGRIAGISGIVAGAIEQRGDERAWRVWFLAGLLAPAVIASLVWSGDALAPALTRSTPWILAAGALVGFGTRLGSGCTSGHGVCGIARLSPRSLIATGVFMATAILTVYIGGVS